MAEQRNDVVHGDGYAVGHIDAMGDRYGFRKIRRELGVTAFGINAVCLPAGYEGGHHYHADDAHRPRHVYLGEARALREGIDLDDGRTAPARVRRLGPERLELTLHEGRKRQVKRMCEAVGHPVRSLERVRFGPVGIGDLPPGGHRRLDAREVARLRRAAASG